MHISTAHEERNVVVNMLAAGNDVFGVCLAPGLGRLLGEAGIQGGAHLEKRFVVAENVSRAIAIHLARAGKGIGTVSILAELDCYRMDTARLGADRGGEGFCGFILVLGCLGLDNRAADIGAVELGIVVKQAAKGHSRRHAFINSHTFIGFHYSPPFTYPSLV